MGDVRGVADDHGHGHRLPQRPAGGQGEGAEDAGAGPGQHHLAEHLPPGGTEGDGPFDLLVRHHGQHVAGDGHHRRQDHDEQDHPGQQQADAVVGAVEQAGPAEHRREEGLDGVAEDGRQHDQAPESVDDARHGGQQFDRGREHGAQPGGHQVGQGEGRAEADRARPARRRWPWSRACRG